MILRKLILRMRASVLSAAFLAASLLPAAADFVQVGDLLSNPNTFYGRTVGTGFFQDGWLFSLDSALFFSASADATNTFGTNTNAFISGFNIGVYSVGADMAIGGGDDSLVLGLPNPAVVGSTNQNAAVAGILAAGTYYVGLQGTGGSASSYGGTITTYAVPGPLLGTGLPGLLAACGALVLLARRRRNQAA